MPRVTEYVESRSQRIYHIALDSENYMVARCMAERACDHYIRSMRQHNIPTGDKEFRHAEAYFWQWWTRLFSLTVLEAKDA